ncbi:hypothetical protein GCM10010269_79730 [Streptomyces humidus]|uniref:Uncharacterized protein n=1 Tax=Streptomyces humidus TaxID=52259 RepID=A0A918LC66_9ACTN|nr:hypothetical protein [Streptomyces humidus]GGS29020.1 hypothetical protein GCM10010269_79730 [Streptomyces humidus]
MSEQLPDPAMFIGPMGHGKTRLPADADAGQLAAVLRRALHPVECRELGPAAAEQTFGPFADTTEGRMTVFMDEDQLRADHRVHDELQQLTRAVRERGPAVDVVMAPLKPSVLLLDEMTHVVGKSAGSASGTGSAGTGWLYAMRRPRGPDWPYSGAARVAAVER